MSHVARRLNVLWWVGACSLLVSCGNRTEDAAPATCEPFAGESLLTPTALSSLAGSYRVTLVATSGDQRGRSAQGVLTLAANPSELRSMSGPGGTMANVAVPYYGTTDLDLAAVGALQLGDTQSEDTMRPGVLAVQNTANQSNTLVIRLGSEANQRDRTRFDGGYTVLRVRSVSSDVMLGNWASGLATEIAGGFFCATRD